MTRCRVSTNYSVRLSWPDYLHLSNVDGPRMLPPPAAPDGIGGMMTPFEAKRQFSFKVRAPRKLLVNKI